MLRCAGERTKTETEEIASSKKAKVERLAVMLGQAKKKKIFPIQEGAHFPILVVSFAHIATQPLSAARKNSSSQTATQPSSSLP